MTCWSSLWRKLRALAQRSTRSNYPSAEDIIPPKGWNWDFAEGKTGPRLSKFQVVKTEFYQGLKAYLSWA